MFADPPTGWKLPDYLAPYEAQFKSMMRSGNKLANIVLSILERELQLPAESLTSMHRLEEDSESFLRLLRYLGVSERTVDFLGFPAHKDALSIAILFTWLGGFQVPKPGAKLLGPNHIADEDWLWVKPQRGTALINLGDAMEIFTNGLLHSGLHRVIRAAGEQAPFDKYSVLIGTRPRLDVVMKPFESPIIPKSWDGQLKEEMNSEQWGTYKIWDLKRRRGERVEKNIVLNANGRDSVLN